MYRKQISFDGGFSNSPYLNINSTILNINPNMWSKRTHAIINFEDIINNVQDINFFELYIKGYMDSQLNKDKLDLIFKKNELGN